MQTLARRWIRPGFLTVMVSLCLLTCTGASFPDSETKPTAKVETIRDLEQKTISLVPSLVQATVGLTIMGGMGAGSGVVVSEDGLILSAGHVVPNPGQEMIVHFADGRRVKAKALGSDRQIDAGLAQITEKGKYPFVKMGKSEDLKKGDWVIAIGNPGGYRPDRKPPIRLGRVISKPNLDLNMLWLRTDAAVAPGDSGGPLFNMKGEVVGIHSNISPDPSENRHVAIDDFTKRWDFMMNKQVTGKMFTSAVGTRSQLGIQPANKGDDVIIAEVLPKSAAEKAGLKVGDIIRTIDSSDIYKSDDVFNKLRNKTSGSKVKLLIERNGEELTITATMTTGPRTYSNPAPDMEEFLKKYGYHRPDGIWEYQETDETKEEFKKLQAAAEARRKKVAGEFKRNEEDMKNAPSLVTALTDVMKPVNPSIVSIFNGDEKAPGEFNEKASVLGTIISSDGYILTKASELKKEFYVKVGTQELDGKLIAQNPEFDLALIKVDGKNLTPVKWGSQSEPSIGAILVSPIVEGKPERRAAIGIVSNAVREIKSTFLNANKAVLGVQFTANSEDPIFEQVTKGGPAEKAGIKAGDFVLTLNGKAVSKREEFQKLLQPMKPGDKVTLEIKRTETDKKETTKKIVVTLGSRADVFANTPLGGPRDFQSRMFETAAGVSKRKEDFPEALTHDAALNGKQMGGPLLNLAGEAIGLNIARFDRTGTYAITYATMKPIIEKLMEEGKK